MNGVARYTEGLLVGYRWYHERGAEPAFEFGHGLGYTSVELEGLEVGVTASGIGLEFSVLNSGDRRGKAVPQVYLTYPVEAGEPSRQLKGFDAIRLEVGESRTARIEITRDDLAIYDEGSGSYQVVVGAYRIDIGLSSRDLRLHTTVQLGAESLSS